MSGSDAPILIVEDVEDHRDILGIALRAAGYRVAYAADGHDAFNRLESGLQPRLIILDLAMPRMDGFEFLQRRTADARFGEVPVIVVTALQEPRDIEQALGVPGIRKPFLLNDILDAVRQQIGKPG